MARAQAIARSGGRSSAERRLGVRCGGACGCARHAKILAESVGLIEVLRDRFRRRGGRGVEVDVFDIVDAGVAETPVVDDLGDGVADAVVVGVLVKDRRGHDEHAPVMQDGIRPLMSPRQPSEVSPNGKSSVNTRSIQPLRIDGKLQKWIGG